MKRINLTDINPETLKAGETLLITGEIFTARDQAHKRLYESIVNNEPLAFDVSGKTVYYAGPCPTPKGMPVGSIGPTSSYRMDKYTPALLDKGLKYMIGKGPRSKEVTDAIKKHKSVYFSAIGGAGAVYQACVKSCKTVAYKDLLSEAINVLYVEDFPVVVAIDSFGNSVY